MIKVSILLINFVGQSFYRKLRPRYIRIPRYVLLSSFDDEPAGQTQPPITLHSHAILGLFSKVFTRLKIERLYTRRHRHNPNLRHTLKQVQPELAHVPCTMPANQSQVPAATEEHNGISEASCQSIQTKETPPDLPVTDQNLAGLAKFKAILQRSANMTPEEWEEKHPNWRMCHPHITLALFAVFAELWFTAPVPKSSDSATAWKVIEEIEAESWDEPPQEHSHDGVEITQKESTKSGG